MKGDFSRLTFDPTKHYSSVRMQQGRVQLDADWNEQMDILLHRFETEISDFIGRSGVPADYNGGTSFQVTGTTDGDLLVAPGRYYIAGKLFQNDAPARLPKEQLPTAPGQYVAYLDAWQSHITPLEDPTLREVALGGPDTATRMQNVWQVHFQKIAARPGLDWQPAGIIALSTTAQAQRGDPGFLVQLDAVQGTELTLAEPPPNDTPFTIVRRWDSAGALSLPPASTDGDGWILLENDIQVQFDLQADKVYNASDYWLFPARTILSDIEWPRDSSDTPLPQPPHGVRHDYVALALLQLKDGTWSLVDADSDLRVKFPALDKGFVSKEGDTIRGALHVGGAGDPSKALTVTGATDLHGDLTVARGKPTTLSGTLTVTGTTTLSSLSITGNVGIGTPTPIARLDITPVVRTDDKHPTAVKGLYVTDDFGESSDGVEFRHTNGTQGIGFGYNTIYATGSNADQHLNLLPRGEGEIRLLGITTASGNLRVTQSFAVGPYALPGTQGRLDVTGSAAELSFARRTLTAWLASPQAGDRFAWYNLDGTARLYTEGRGDVVTVSSDGDVEFAPTAQANILWNSRVNAGSDKAFVLFRDNSTYLSPQGTTQECARLSIGVFNDFGNDAKFLDALDIQGGTRLTLNAGTWDAELNTAIGTPTTGNLLQGISFRINNSEKMRLDRDGKLGITESVCVGPFTLPNSLGRLCVTGSFAEIGFVKRSLTAWPASPAPGDRYVWYNDNNGVAHLWTEAAGDLLSVDAHGNVTIKGNIGSHGYSPTPARSDWLGGIHTWDVEAEGTIWPRNRAESGGRDLAENYAADVALEAGDVVSLALDSDHIVPAATPNDTRVIGVVSTVPGFLLNAPRPQVEENMFPVALCGRVPCKVVDANGPITRGDLLTTSAQPGYAMKAVPIVVNGQAIFRPRSILGKALEPFASGQGTIEIFVTRG